MRAGHWAELLLADEGDTLCSTCYVTEHCFDRNAGRRTSRRAEHALFIAASVSLEVEPAPNNARRLYAGVNIAAPVRVVWDALTDYDGLGNFIPGAARAPLRRALHGLEA